MYEWFPVESYPTKRGNPLCVYADGKAYELLNLNYENFSFLVGKGLEFPLEIQEYSKSYANVIDPRVPKEFLIPKD